MKRAAFTALLAALASTAAVSLASAAAPANGRLIVSNPDLNVGANGAIHLSAIPAPNTFRTTIYAPAGYRAPGDLGAVGNNVGKAQVFATQADGSRVTLNGQLSVVPPATVPQTQCDSSSTHAAVWMLKANQTGGTGTITFPIYVDTPSTDPNVPAAASYALRFCAADRGVNVTEVDLDLVRMFVNPAARGMYLWRAVYEPSQGDGTTIASAESVGVVAAVPVDAQVTMRATKVRSRKGWYTFTGTVTAVRHALGNVKVQLFAGHQRKLALNRPRATVRTKADGTYRVTLHLAGKGAWYARARASTPYQDITAGGGCSSVKDTLAAKTCVDATLAPFVVLTKPLLRVG
ncbi:MAG TPA: hypothetical protein VHC01_03245 [Gaiellaceae bacterium]|nr:hypothetical protein [Gaiellaceae bacterium]